MIEIYLQIQDQKRLNNVLKSFNSFNSVFNLIIKKVGVILFPLYTFNFFNIFILTNLKTLMN